MKPIRLIQMMILIMSLLKAFSLIAGASAHSPDANFSAYTTASVKTGVAYLFAPPPANHKFPAELIGTWYTGALPLTDFYDPVSGTWRAPNGLGQTYTFRGDGHYTYAAYLRLQTGMCLTEVATYREGKAKAAQQTLTLTPDYVKTRTVINCGSNSETITDGPFEATTLAYDVTEKAGDFDLTVTTAGASISFNRQNVAESLASIGGLTR